MTRGNPFIGLRPFEAEHSVLFFGRDEQIAELLRRLHEQRFVAVVGRSGCGKSSLVRAGIIPKLEGGFLVAERDRWHISVMKPGDTPIDNLATALASSDDADNHASVRTLAREIREGGVRAVLAQLSTLFTSRNSNLLLVIDQFEELLREDRRLARGADDDASDFVSIIVDLAAQTEMPIYVVLTVRSDFLRECDRFLGLPEAINRSQYFVPRLTRQQRREAIEGPIRLYRAHIASRLTDRLLNESVDTDDDLPVLQYALMRTWDEWNNQKGPIDIVHYDAIGTVYEALSRDANAAVERMSERQLLLTKRLFQSLTRVDPAGRHVRRRARLGDVAERTGADVTEIWPIVQRFRGNDRSFLIASSDDPEDNPLLDISHESLIRQWDTLKAWVRDEAESVQTYRRLADTALLYKQGRAGLYRDPDLQVALEWQASEVPTKGWASEYHAAFDEAIQFLEISTRASERERAETAFLRRWRFIETVIGALVVALFFLYFKSSPLARFWNILVQPGANVIGGLLNLSATSDAFLPKRNGAVAVQAAQPRDVALGFLILLIAGHILLFFALTRVGKRLYHSYLFRARRPRTVTGARHRSSLEPRVRRGVAFVAIVWSIAGGFLLLQVGLPELVDLALRKGLIPDSLTMQPPRAAGVDCAPAIQRTRAAVVDPRVAAQARLLVWRMGFHTGFAAGIGSATAGSKSPVNPSALLAEQPHQIANLLGVDSPTLPVIQHAANALSEFQSFVVQGAGCVAPQLADRYSPRQAALYRYGLIVGHAAVYRIKAPMLDPLFVPDLRVYGREAEVPTELSQPFVDRTLDSLPGDGPQQRIQFAVNRIEAFLKANP